MSAPRTSHRRRRRPPAAEITADTPIWCPACQAEHPSTAFNKESRRFSGLAGVCREAQATARQTAEGRAATRRRNKRRWGDPEYRDKSLEWQRARRRRQGANIDLQRARRRLQAIVDERKRQGCVDCGYGVVPAIDPDHVDSGTKEGHESRWCSYAPRRLGFEPNLRRAVPDVRDLTDASLSNSAHAHGGQRDQVGAGLGSWSRLAPRSWDQGRRRVHPHREWPALE